MLSDSELALEVVQARKTIELAGKEGEVVDGNAERARRRLTDVEQELDRRNPERAERRRSTVDAQRQSASGAREWLSQEEKRRQAHNEQRRRMEELRQRDRQQQHEVDVARGRAPRPPVWVGPRPEPLAVLGSPMVWSMLRGIAWPGMRLANEDGSVTTFEDVRRVGGMIGQILEAGDLVALFCSVHLIEERGEDGVVTFNPREMMLWPQDAPASPATFKRLERLGLLTFKQRGPDSWTLAYGAQARALVESFAVTFDLTPKPKRSLRDRFRAGPSDAEREIDEARRAVEARAELEASS